MSSAPTAAGSTTAHTAPVLEVEGLSVLIGRSAQVTPVRDMSLVVRTGEIVGMVGESGCGKTLTALAVADLLPASASRTARRLQFLGRDLLTLPRRERDPLLGQKMAVVFQDPMAALNPVRRVGVQLVEAARRHRHLDRTAARTEGIDRLREVRIAAPERRMDEYPDSFSGGMRQRAVIAMGLMNRPALLVADEPTTALDVTVQADVVDLLRAINREDGVAILFVSHNIALLSEVCHRIVVMYGGRVVEELGADRLATRAVHPYTRALMASVPSLDSPLDQPLVTIPGSPPEPDEPVPGCPFAPRCGLAVDACHAAMPPLEVVDGQHRAACWVAAPGSG